MECNTIKENENLRKHLEETFGRLEERYEDGAPSFYHEEYEPYTDSNIINSICESVYRIIENRCYHEINFGSVVNLEEKIYNIVVELREKYTIMQGINGSTIDDVEIFDEILIKCKAAFPRYEHDDTEDGEDDIL